MRLATLVAALLLALPAWGADLPYPPGSLPDPAKTPGELNPVLTKDKICARGFRTGPFRHVTTAMKDDVFHDYGISCGRGKRSPRLPRCGLWEIDHVISIELGGANTRENLFPQLYAGIVWNAHVKDHLENELHRLVCAGAVTLEDAQTEIATDWIASWRNRFGREAP